MFSYLFDIIPQCSFCSTTQMGVRLTECGHYLCRECLGSLVRGTVGDTVLCPCGGGGPACGKPLQHRDIKKGVTTDTYHNFLKQSMRLYNWYCQCPEQFFGNPTASTCLICNKNIFKLKERSQLSEQVNNPSHMIQENKKLNVKAYSAFLNNNGQNKIKDLSLTFTCDWCSTSFKLDEVQILDCCHIYCYGCMYIIVNHNTLGNFMCPYSHCETFIPYWKLKSLLSTGTEPLNPYFKENKPVATLPKRNDSVLCPDSACKGWIAVSPETKLITCKVCNTLFCVVCKCRHNPTILTCEEYQRTLNNPDQYTLELLDEMLIDERALKCPGCSILIEKDKGCDWVKCSSCDTEICWVTRGPRWGPLGVGDTSAGCRCKEGGVKCHPDCKNCH